MNKISKNFTSDRLTVEAMISDAVCTCSCSVYICNCTTVSNYAGYVAQPTTFEHIFGEHDYDQNG